ncbi:PB1 domain containing protein [Pelomyxa schiedti]|nr:PB1 domain containing protein [Pelomyxa schiedti]
MSNDSVVIKVTMDGNQCQAVVPSSLSYPDLVNWVKSAFKLPPTFPVALSYRDDEGDKVTLSTTNELATAMQIAKQQGAASLDVTLSQMMPRTTASSLFPTSSPVGLSVSPPTSLPTTFPSFSSPGSFTAVPPVNPLTLSISQQPFVHGFPTVVWGSLVPKGVNAHAAMAAISASNSVGAACDNLRQAVARAISGKPAVEHDAKCDSCQQRILGICYHCTQCPDYDLCEKCECMNGGNGQLHNADHIFTKHWSPRPQLPEHIPEASVPNSTQPTPSQIPTFAPPIATPIIPATFPSPFLPAPPIATPILSPSPITPSMFFPSYVAPPDSDSSPTFSAQFLSDKTIPEGTIIDRSKPQLIKLWRLKNTGSNAWPEGCKLVFAEGQPPGCRTRLCVPQAEPGAQVDVGVQIMTPSAPGKYKTVWRLVDNHGRAFGPALSASYVVPGSDMSGSGIATPHYPQDNAQAFPAKHEEMLCQLEEMGFHNRELLVQLLAQYGSVQDVVSALQGGDCGM